MATMNQDLLRDAVAYADQWMAYQQERREIPGVVVAIRPTISCCSREAMATPISSSRSP